MYLFVLYKSGTSCVSIKLEDVIFEVGANIGQSAIYDDPTIENLESRINYLVNQERITESFLIEGLIGKVTQILNGDMNNLGERILLNEELLEISKAKDFSTEGLERVFNKF
ncbi:hypothetical protein ACU5CE_31815 [Priestia megaterium]|uniref:hypothetical protein n=1 Tax=Priestia megaterium TaxID=1404 RepID=UPI00406BD681